MVKGPMARVLSKTMSSRPERVSAESRDLVGVGLDEIPDKPLRGFPG
jgi:hypothetical protein